MENTIQIEENNVLRFKVKKANGEDTGLEIKFDLQDIELPLRINKMEELHRNNVSILRQKAKVIDNSKSEIRRNTSLNPLARCKLFPSGFALSYLYLTPPLNQTFCFVV